MSLSKKQEYKLPALAADTATDKFDTDEFLFISTQFSWENGAAFSADVTLQGSNDGNNWADFPGGTSSVSGASGTQMFDIANTAVTFIRVNITSVAGTADAEVDLSTKSIKFNR